MRYKAFAVITASEPFRSTQYPGNRGIKFTIALNDHTGLTFPHVVLLEAENPMVSRIGYEMLSQMCLAVGIMQVGDSSELHNVEFIAHYTMEASLEGDKLYPRLKRAEALARLPVIPDRERIARWLDTVAGRPRARKLAKRIRRGDWE